MCGRFAIIGRAWSLPIKLGMSLIRPPRYNIAPTQYVPVVLQEAGSAPKVEELYWGLVPSWARDMTIGSLAINACADTLDTRRMFRSAFKERRCLIPASGFYEWKAVPGKARIPYYFTATDEEAYPLAFAGLWEDWDAAGQPVRSFTIITEEANATVLPVHHRMPVILHPDDWERWLDPGNQDTCGLKDLLRPAPDHILTSWQVSQHVNNARNDGEECILPVALSS